MAVLLHTRIRVSDLDRSAAFYCDHFGFVVKSRSEKSPAGNQIMHLELPGNAHTLELTYSDDYELNVPEDLMHLAIGVPDLIAFCSGSGEQGHRNLARRLARDVSDGTEDGLCGRPGRLRDRTA